MSDSRVVILDGGQTLFPDAIIWKKAKADGDDKDDDDAAEAEKKPKLPDSDLILKPIPSFQGIVEATCREVAPQYSGSKVTRLDIGVVCHSSAVDPVGRLVYSKVQELLKAEGVGVKRELS